MARNLVVVESPAKAKTIGKYLGKDYDVVASMGHVRDLPKSDFAVDINGGVSVTYEVTQKGKKVVSSIRKAAKSADLVFLATDPDREGEAIARHIAGRPKLTAASTRRVTFTEIHRRRGPASLRRPGDRRPPGRRPAGPPGGRPDRRLQAVAGAVAQGPGRPFPPAGSVGRAQMIVDREREIDAFQAREYMEP